LSESSAATAFFSALKAASASEPNSATSRSIMGSLRWTRDLAIRSVDSSPASTSAWKSFRMVKTVLFNRSARD